MKRILLAAFFLIFSMGNAQEAPASENVSRTEVYKLDKPETYNFNNQVYTFTPEVNSIRIKKLENLEEVDFGILRKTTDDGLYILTSTVTEDVSFGRFDSLGNFKTLRYDRQADRVLEDFFEKRVPTQLSSKK